MGRQNLTVPTALTLSAVSSLPELQLPLFWMFLILYVFTMVGNLGMIILTKLDAHLHTPMYFFIRHLAYIDLGDATVIYPKMLVNFVIGQNTISYHACAIQMALFVVFIVSELFILSAMAYDRYVAICYPLLYNVIMCWRRCHLLVGIPYLYCSIQALLFTCKIFTSSFCTSLLSHFYYDNIPVSLMLCSNGQDIASLINRFAIFNLTSSLLVVLLSYLMILLALGQMRSADGRKKAFSTCASHLTVVVVFFGTLFFMYVQPKSAQSSDIDKLSSVFYTLVIPMLNPLIYSFRNKEVKNAFHRVFGKKFKKSYRDLMGRQNLTVPANFILSAVSRQPELKLPLFWIFLIIYIFTMVGNLGMIILTKLDAYLHTPMYFFIRHLAYMDLGDATSIYPKMLLNFVMGQNTISYHACATQMAFFIMFIISELFILSAMAYDRYVAICNPLLYNVIMSRTRCHVLVGIPYLYSTLQALMITIKIFTLSFCSSQVSHFYCDDLPVLLMLCSNAQDIELLIILFSAFNLISSLLVVLLSYMLILLAICRMNSAEGRKKAFSTCGSHLTVVVAFYGTLLFMYVQPKSTHSFETDKLTSVFYTLVIPMLNPVIYSFRNKESNTYMALGNMTQVTEFVLIGVSDQPDLQVPLFLIFLVIYCLTVMGNLGIITLTIVDSKLQTPMYFFLHHLAIINFSNSTVIAPKMLFNFLVKEKTTSYYACATQLGGFLVFIVAEVFMLAVMAYDRYVAICNPLLYMVVVSRRVCLLLVSFTYLYGFGTAAVITPCVFSVSYCSSNGINHFYCDIMPLLTLSCSDTSVPEIVVFISAASNIVFSMMIVLISYFNIVLSILRIRSSEGRKKAFSTCGSHMMAVAVFYGTLLFMYLQPRTNYSLDTDKMASVFYTLVIPMLNPMIYSLRNKDVKAALQRFMTNPCNSCKPM
ncbi:uncharacterized protein O8D03_013190 [Erethizon dorsatum]